MYKQKILIFSPNNCFPPQHGAHARCAQQIYDLKEYYQLNFASSRYTSDIAWPNNHKACNSFAKRNGIFNIFLFEDSLAGRINQLIGAILRRAYRITGYKRISIIQAWSQQWIMAIWFGLLSFTINPMAVIIHHTKWSFLVTFIKSPLRVLELPDILPINHYLITEISNAFKQRKATYYNYDNPWPWFIENSEQLPSDVVNTLKLDIQCLNKYDLIWFISSRDQKLLQSLGLTTRSQTIYPSVSSNLLIQPKKLPPLMPLGPNVFNAYSLHRFIAYILPLISKEILEESKILITGSLGTYENSVELIPPLSHLGFVNNYFEKLAQSSLMLVPTGVGTGQQTKIFEALAVGTPVLAFKSAVPDDVLAENPCIMAAKDEKEFAQYLSDFLIDSNIRIKYAQLAVNSAILQAQKTRFNIFSKSLS